MANMRLTIARQAASRLRTIESRMAQLIAEKAMIEQLLDDAKKHASSNRVLFRKKSLSKHAIERRIVSAIGRSNEISARVIFDAVLKYDPVLKPATFRSHLKRMTAYGLLKRGSVRGTYALTSESDGSESHHAQEAQQSKPTQKRRITYTAR